MDTIVSLVKEYWPLLLAIAAGIDALAGVIPDKYVPYIGFLKRMFLKLKGDGKETVKAIAMLLLPLLMVGFMAGCATNPTKAQYIAGAKIIAREAGYLVAMKNPEMAAAVRLGYNMIKDEDGDEFRALFLNGLQQMLEAEGVAGSDRLAKSAEDLLAVFGIEKPSIDMIDADFIEKFAVDDIKDVVIAFIEGMGPG